MRLTSLILRLVPLFAVASVMTTLPEDGARAAYPGTNGRIAFSNFTNNDAEIWTMNPDGSDRTQLTQTAEDSNSQPSFSADGTMIAFRRNSFGGGGLFVVGAGGGNAELIPNTEDAFEVSWAPDGTQIAFTRMLGPSAVFKMNLDGTGNTNLTSDAPTFAESSPDWSPLGTKIAYVASSFGATDIYVMNTDGSGKTNVTNTPEVIEGNPDFSPNGQRLIFDVITQDGPGAAGQEPRDIAVINVNGTGFELIKDDVELDQYDPVFSPDGTQIAYTQTPVNSGFGALGFGDTGIVVADADGGNAQMISPASPDDVSPDWGVDEPAPPFNVWGDSDCSGTIDAADAIPALKAGAGLPQVFDNCPIIGGGVLDAQQQLQYWGDFDCDLEVEPTDILLLFLYLAALPGNEIQDCPEFGSPVTLAG